MKKILNNKYTPFAIMFIALFVKHICIDFVGDDLYFADRMGMDSYKEFIMMRYYSWSSRVVIETVLSVLVHLNIYVWRIVDTFLYVYGAYAALRLVNTDDNRYINALGCMIFLWYPFNDLNSAGWVSTTTNYLWCFSMGMAAFMPLINNARTKKTPVIQYALSIICLLYAVNQEQMCAILLGFNLLYLLYTLIKKNKINIYNILSIILSVLSVIFIMKCPGNKVRFRIERINWCYEFPDYSVIKKLYFGVVSTADILIANKLILFAFVLFLSWAAYIYSSKNINKVIAVVSFAAVSSVTVLKETFIGIFPNTEKYFDLLGSEWIPVTSRLYLLVISVSLVLLIAAIIYMLFVIFKTEKLLPVFIFIGGICSRLIMGFSPTLYVSGDRTAIFLYMALIILTIYVVDKLYREQRLNNNMKIILTSAIMFLSTASYINII